MLSNDIYYVYIDGFRCRIAMHMCDSGGDDDDVCVAVEGQYWNKSDQNGSRADWFCCLFFFYYSSLFNLLYEQMNIEHRTHKVFDLVKTNQ